MESCVSDTIVRHVFQNNLVTDKQWAYREGRLFKFRPSTIFGITSSKSCQNNIQLTPRYAYGRSIPKKSKVFICAWHPMILPPVYRTGVSHQGKLSTPEEELHNCLGFAACAYYPSSGAKAMYAPGPSRFSFISPRRFSCFGENFMRETISFAVSIDPLHKWRLHLNNNTYTSLASHS